MQAAVNSIPEQSIDRIYVKYLFDFHIFSFFLVFDHDFVIYVDFTHVTASNISTDDVINYVTHRISNINL